MPTFVKFPQTRREEEFLFYFQGVIKREKKVWRAEKRRREKTPANCAGKTIQDCINATVALARLTPPPQSMFLQFAGNRRLGHAERCGHVCLIGKFAQGLT